MHRFETIRSSCRHVDGRRLWLGKAALTATAVKITGWRGLSRYVRRVVLDDMLSVSRRTGSGSSNIEFRLVDGSTWTADVHAPGLWRIEVARRIRSINPDGAADGDEEVRSVLSGYAPGDEIHAEPVSTPLSESLDELDETIVSSAPVSEARLARDPIVEEASADAQPAEEQDAQPAEEQDAQPAEEQDAQPVEEPEAQPADEHTDAWLTERPVSAESQEGPSAKSAAGSGRLDIGSGDHAPASYSLTEAYSAAYEPGGQDEDESTSGSEPAVQQGIHEPAVEPEPVAERESVAEPDPDPKPNPNPEPDPNSEPESVPGWRPIHFIVGSSQAASGWRPIDHLGSADPAART